MSSWIARLQTLLAPHPWLWSLVAVAGLLLDRLGRMAVPGDQVEVGPHRITALRLSGNRVERVRVEVVPAEDRARPGR